MNLETKLTDVSYSNRTITFSMASHKESNFIKVKVSSPKVTRPSGELHTIDNSIVELTLTRETLVKALGAFK